MAPTICPVTPGFVAEVGDVNLSQPIGASDLLTIRQAFTKYAVLIFPDQHLTAEQHLEFASQFGPLETTIAVHRGEARLRSSSATGSGTLTARSSGGQRSPRCSTRDRSLRLGGTRSLPTSARRTMHSPRTSSRSSLRSLPSIRSSTRGLGWVSPISTRRSGASYPRCRRWWCAPIRNPDESRFTSPRTPAASLACRRRKAARSSIS